MSQEQKSGQRGGSDFRGGRALGQNSSYQPGNAPYVSQPRGLRGRRGGAERGTRGSDRQPKKQERQDYKPYKGQDLNSNDIFGQDSALVGFDYPTQKINKNLIVDDAIEVVQENKESDLLNFLGLGSSENKVQQNDLKSSILIDDALIIEDQPKNYEEKKDSKPLWFDESRVKYSNKQLLDAFVHQEKIDFDLFTKDYMEVFEIFSQNSQKPFNLQEQLLAKVDVKKFQDRTGQSQKPQGLQQKPGQRTQKPDWQNKQRYDQEEEEDPEWIDFDAEKQPTKFFGDVMEDESQIREQVAKKKEEKLLMQEEKKRKVIEDAQTPIKKQENQTQEEIDKEKLREAEALAALIEQESYSKYDIDFERKYKGRRQDELLNDEQLIDLFTEMKKESMRGRVLEKQEKYLDDDDDFNQDMEAFRDLDDTKEEIVVNDLEQSSNQFFTNEIKQKVEEFKKKQVQKLGADQNLEDLFKGFAVVTQQRHKVNLESICAFQPYPITSKDLNGNLIGQILKEINPFAPYVIQEVFQDSLNEEKKNDDRIWELDESLFKRPGHEVNPENLRKTSSQMFSLYKFYENPCLLVKNKHQTEKEGFIEVGELVPKITFFETPIFNFEVYQQMQMTNFNQESQAQSAL